MPLSEGKKFEADFKKSIPEDVFFQRIKDDTMGFKGVVNICDYIMYTMPNMFLFELKSTKLASMPFTNLKKAQVEGLSEASVKDGIRAGFIFNFRTHGKTYFLDAECVASYLNLSSRKSFPLEMVEKRGIEVAGTLKRTRTTYDVAGLLLALQGKGCK